MIQMLIREGQLSRAGAARGQPLPDVASTTWNGSSYTTATAHGAVCALARKLVVAGCADQPWESYTETATRALFGPSLHGVAKLTISEDDRGIRFTRYRSMPELP